MALTVFKGLTKLAIGGGAIYYTIDQGVWNNSEQSVKAAEKVKTNVLATTNEYSQQVITSTKKGVSESLPMYWNSGVQKTFSTLAETPEYGKQALSSTKELIAKQLKS